MSKRVIAYLYENVIGGMKEPAGRNWRVSLAVALLFFFSATAIGFSSQLFKPGLVPATALLYLPVTLLVFPSFLEELIFRGCLIPRDTLDRGCTAIVARTVVSTLVFTAWHPLNALTVNPGARSLFLNPCFLMIVMLLGVACSLCYIYSRSLWTPVLVHWLTVLIWVLFLGGRNLILEVAAGNGF